MPRTDFVPVLTALQLHLLYGGALIAVSVALLAFVTSEVTRNYSQIDKLWSIMPPVFAWYFAGASGWEPRLVLMAVLATAWGARLTYNFCAPGRILMATLERCRGLPLGGAAREPAPRRYVAVAALQSWLRVALPGPAAAADHAAGRRGGGFRRDRSTSSMRSPRRCSSAAFCSRPLPTSSSTTFRRRSTVAATPASRSRATWRAGSAPQASLRSPGTRTSRRSRRSGAAFYLFGVAATGRWLNWSVIGVVLLILLFQGSTQFTEKISLGKYPEYAEYRRRVPRFLPRPWARRPVF